MANGYTVQGYRAMALGFHHGASAAERAAVRATVERSRLVYLVVPDTAPTQLTLPPADSTRT